MPAIKDKNKGYITNCYIQLRSDMKLGEGIFKQTEDGYIIACLDGYAIIPRERYEALVQLKKGEDELG